MRLPDFLVIGAARCGTTWLYGCLQSHPRVYVPECKRPEPHFFLKEAEYEHGLEYYSRRYFSKAAADLVAGEASTSYLYQPWVPARIHRDLPEVKLIAMLRNPIERAFSNYTVTVRNGLEDLGFSEALRCESKRLTNSRSAFEREISPYAYVDRGRYHAQLSRYLALFPMEQLYVIVYDDVLADPAEVAMQVYRFLDLDASFEPPSLGQSANAADYAGTSIDPADRRFIRDALADETSALSEWLGRDLSSWC